MRVMLIAVPNVLEDKSGVEGFENRMTPMELATLGAFIEQKHEVKVLDALALGLNKKQILREIEGFNPEIVSLNAFDRCRWAVDSAAKLSKEIKGRKVGLMWSYEPELLMKFMEEYPDFDFSVFGDPEFTLLELADKNTYEGIKGIIYRKGGKIIRNETRELIKDLDILPFPGRHLLNMKVYQRLPHELIRSPSYDMLLSRGCPFMCTFCMLKVSVGRARRTRSPKKAVEEMDILAKKGAKQIHFQDPTFTMSKEWTLEFCERLIKKNLDLVWTCMTRTDRIDEEMLRAMKKAKCVSILYGIESLNQKSLDLIRKGTKVDDMIKKIKLTKKIGIETRCSLIVGLPGESKESLMKNVDLLIKLDPDFAQFHSIAAFPNTELYETAEQHGTLITDEGQNIKKFDISGKLFVPSGYKDEAEINSTQRAAYRKFYFRPRYVIKRIFKLSELKRNLRGLKVFLSLDRR